MARYRLITKVGTGSYGEVWRAKDTKEDKIVAIKKMIDIEESTFIREKRILTHLNQTACLSIPMIHNTFKHKKAYYIVMDFVEGHTLESWSQIRQHTRNLHLTYLNMITSLAQALMCLHDSGYSHRDLKLQNVIWTGKNSGDPGHVSLVDFGLSCDQRWFSWTDRCSQSSPFGTPYYVSPELWEKFLDNSKSIDDYFKIDIYAFGVLIYMLFHHSEPLFPGKTMEELQVNVLTGNHLFVSMPWPELKELVLAMIHFVPEKRPTIENVYDTLKRVKHKYNPLALEMTTIRHGKQAVRKKRRARRHKKPARTA